jgi:hypothetical protein
MTITEFIRARLAEEEQTAQAAAGAGVEVGVWTLSDATATQVRDGNGNRVGGHTWPHKGAHIALHDPARVLREIAARRAVLDMALTEQEAGDRYGAGFNEASEGWHDAQEHVLKQLASVYADHPDYDQEWAP